jgi:hypothetical protein
MQGRRVELRQNIDAPQTGVHAVGNRNIDQPIFSGQWHRWLRPVFRQREQTRSLPAAHDHGKHIAGVGGHALTFCHK